MSDELPESDVERVVRDHLRRCAAGIDPAALQARIRATLAESPDVLPIAPARRFRVPVPRRRWFATAAVAAGVFLAFWVGLSVSPSREVSAATLLNEARATHSQPVDRCYLVETKWESDAAADRRFPLLTQPRSMRLWTRGDQFWIESQTGQRHVAWGRDDQGNVWLAPGPRIGLRFEASEVPEPIALACDVSGMRLESLLGEMAEQFDLTRDPTPAGGSGTTFTVRAQIKSGATHPTVRTAVADIDTETRVVKRLVLQRMARGRPAATTTFTLVETQLQDGSRYQLEGHLEPPYKVFSRTVDPQRRELLMHRFGAKTATDADDKAD
jgi:hypothetical protein